jgi:hypothetical protein
MSGLDASHSRLEPSMSVNKNVTVPAGSRSPELYGPLPSPTRPSNHLAAISTRRQMNLSTRGLAAISAS